MKQSNRMIAVVGVAITVVICGIGAILLTANSVSGYHSNIDALQAYAANLNEVQTEVSTSDTSVQEIRIYSTNVYTGEKTDNEVAMEKTNPDVVIYQYSDGTIKVFDGSNMNTLPVSTPEADSGSIDGSVPTTVVVDDNNAYIIEHGDTLTSVSAKFGISVDELANYNQIRNVNVIYAESALQIPTK